MQYVIVFKITSIRFYEKNNPLFLPTYTYFGEFIFFKFRFSKKINFA